ncbi:MAG: chemotaxis protein [Desulfobacteraceae bacterium]|nr:MAG: chemotaxis protein [Desulfobacteraceae bacterium]
MKTLEKVDWDPAFSVDIPEIDELQKKMFALFNALIDLKDKGADTKDCTNMISEINEYCKFYFSKEEEYLKREGYPDFESHIREHRQFVKSTISLRREVADTMDNMTYEVIDELREWLIAHIKNSDSLYVPFLRIKKYVKESSSK